jgi:integrase
MPYLRKGSQNWWVKVRDEDGNVIRKSAGTTDRKAAEAYEAKIKVEVWQKTYMGMTPKHSWEEACGRYLEETQHKKSRANDISHIRWLTQRLQGRTLDKIGSDTVGKLIKDRRSETCAPATVNRTMATLREILNKAAFEWDWIRKAPRIRMLPEPQRRIRWLTGDEATRLFAELPEHLAELVRFSLATGLREANATGLRWEQVDLKRKLAWVYADEAKGKQSVGVPLNKDAMDVLLRQVGKHRTIVFTYDGYPIRRAGGHAWRAALRRAGIVGFRWHDLRHTWATMHIQSGTPINVLQELGGWSSIDMVRKYAHLSQDQLDEHARNIEGKALE